MLNITNYQIYSNQNHNELSPHPKEIKPIMSKRHLYSPVHCSTIYNCWEVKTTKLTINWRKGKENIINTWKPMLFSHKKEWNPVICNNMDTTGDHYVRWNKSRLRRVSISWSLCIYISWSYKSWVKKVISGGWEEGGDTETEKGWPTGTKLC